MAEFLSSLDQINLLRRALGNPATGDVPDTALAQYLWLAECDLCEMYEFSELSTEETLSTSEGTYDYQMTEADILRFLTPANNTTSNIEMKVMDKDWDRKIGSRLVGQGSPFYWFENGVGTNNRKEIRLRPIPDGVYSIVIPFVKIPTMPDSTTATRSDLPASHALQTINRATEIGLMMQGERAEADAQEKLSGTGTYAARHALPKAAFYTNRLMTFQKRMNINRRR